MGLGPAQGHTWAGPAPVVLVASQQLWTQTLGASVPLPVLWDFLAAFDLITRFSSDGSSSLCVSQAGKPASLSDLGFATWAAPPSALEERGSH